MWNKRFSFLKCYNRAKFFKFILIYNHSVFNRFFYVLFKPFAIP